MQARVDARRQVVTNGKESWPFEVDCRDASVQIEIGERSFRVRSLTWREKNNLARFAHLGEEFVRRQFLKLCVGEASMPAPESQREALFALAAWLNDPGPEPALPLNTEILSRTLAGLCRSMMVGPEAFDNRPALEVEALWRLTEPRLEPGIPESANHPASTGTVHSDWTKIIITPDADPEAGESRTAEPAETAQDAPPISEPAPQAENTREPQAGRSQEAPAALSNPPRRQDPVLNRTPEKVQAAERDWPAGARFRVMIPVSLPGPRQPAASVSKEQPVSSPPRGTAVATAIEEQPVLSPAPDAAPAAPSAAHAPDKAVPLVRFSTAWPSGQSASVATQGLVVRAPEPAAPSAAPSTPAQAAAAFDLLEELADRLEEAAEELGIDIHS